MKYRFNPFRFVIQEVKRPNFSFSFDINTQNPCAGSYGLIIWFDVDIYKRNFSFRISPLGELIRR